MPRYPSTGNRSNGDFVDDRDEKYWKFNSIKCRIWNKTRYTFRWEDFRLQEYSIFTGNGPWFNNIKHEIGPGDYTDLRMQSHKNGHGVEVWITYNTDVGPVEFHFNNPYVGSNSYHTYKLPAEFISVHNSGDAFPTSYGKGAMEFKGVGNSIIGDHPHFEWTIKDREAPSAERILMDHLYTTDPNGEKDLSQIGYNLEGIVGYVYPSSAPNTVPLYRFYNPTTGDHFYTQSSNSEGATDYKAEGIACYLPSSQDSGASPFYRFWGWNDHFYTAHDQYEGCTEAGYQKEGDAGFIYKTQVANTVPFYRWHIRRGR